MKKEEVDQLNRQFESASAQDIVAHFVGQMGDQIVLASSLGAEDQVLTDMAVKVNPAVRIIVLDTGRLHQETYDVMEASRKRYGINYEIYFPNFESVQDLMRQKGPNSFYESVENRKECCYIRKVEPLNRALSTAKAWITGLRRDQAVSRTDLQVVEWDDGHQIGKINPLASWSVDEVWAYIRDNEVPYNALHDKGFPSIGCAPCTRAIKEGEDIRSGRWWWETPEGKECGLHVVDGKLVPKRPKTED